MNPEKEAELAEILDNLSPDEALELLGSLSPAQRAQVESRVYSGQLADVTKAMPRFRPVIWYQSGMNQLVALARDVGFTSCLVPNASIEILRHPHRNQVVGFVLFSGAHLMSTNIEILLPKADGISALALLRLARKRDIQHLGELSPEAKRAYRAAEGLAKRRSMRLREKEALKLLTPKAVAA